MKKFVALLLAACLTLGCASALAAGKLTVNQETYTAVAGYSFVGYVFAEVENTGDKNIEFGNGLLEILTADGDPMDSTDIYSMYPSILAPGEKGYVSTLQYVDAAESIEDISDYTLTITGKSTQEEAIARLAYCSGVEVAQSVPQAEGSVTVVTAACRAYLPMDDLVDKKAETARLTKELEGAKKQLATAEAKLQNEKFISKAPQKVIDGVKDNAEKLREKVRGIEEALAALQ